MSYTKKTINTIEELKIAIGYVFSNISNSCAICDYPDCVGYINVFPIEEEILLDNNINLIQINGDEGPIFIDSYMRNQKGEVIVDYEKPPCVYRNPQNRQCGIYHIRPLICHLYPLGLETIDEKHFWVLHLDCQYVQDKILSEQYMDLILKLTSLTKDISPSLRKFIYKVYDKVNQISKIESPNKFVILSDL